MCRCGNPVLCVWDQYSGHDGPELMLLSLLLPVQEGETQDRKCNHQATRPMSLCCSGYRGSSHAWLSGWLAEALGSIPSSTSTRQCSVMCACSACYFSASGLASCRLDDAVQAPRKFKRKRSKPLGDHSPDPTGTNSHTEDKMLPEAEDEPPATLSELTPCDATPPPEAVMLESSFIESTGFQVSHLQ